ncbi:MAG: AAA family ATPase, partial [Nitrospinae bacterium]|nr:AAA family ATPase [Nitrospinota bacterium]
MDSQTNIKNHKAELQKQPSMDEAPIIKDKSGLLLKDYFVGEGPKIKEIKDKISLVADTDVAILIQGETG